MTSVSARSVRTLGVIIAFVAVFVFGATHVGCGEDGKEYFTVVHDAGNDADDAARDGEAEIDPTLGGPCTEDTQCVDAVTLADGGSVPIGCTSDRCDKTLNRCRHTPDNTLCDDKEYCNGQEKCVPRTGCVAGPVVTCQDESACSIDICVEATKSCVHKERDTDGDGDPDDHCVAKKDCDDTDPTVASTKVEICGNFKDDNCNGLIDEKPGCIDPKNDTCATAATIKTAGTYLLTSVAAKRDYATPCSVKNDAASKDIVVEIVVPANEKKNVLVTATTSAPANEVAVALRTGVCEAADGGIPTEEGCGAISGSSRARAIAREIDGGANGKSVWAIIKTQVESAVDVKVEYLPSAPKPANEACGQATPVPVDGSGEPVPFTVSLIDPAKDVVSACDPKAKTGELLYSFTLTQERDVRIFASTLLGPGDPVVSLRSLGACTTELRCRAAPTPPLFARKLAAGTYQFSVAGTGQIDASILVKTYPPTNPPANQSCTTAPALVPNTSFIVNLADQEDAIKSGCGAGGPNAAYTLELTQESDVLIIGRFAQNEQGSISVHGPVGGGQPLCSANDRLGCFTGTTPTRLSLRKVPAGSYRVVIADDLGQNVELTALVRPYTPPTMVASDGCLDALTIPASGGFFVGDTKNNTADFNAGCDAPGLPNGGAKDQLLRLDLAAAKRIVFDMTGSVYTTLFDLRQGASCPGIEVPNACHVGFGPNRSFLDVKLGAGTYWVQIDGYAQDQGSWNLDVRVLP